MEEKILLARIEDLVQRADNGEIGYIGFLSESETALADSYLKHRTQDYTFFGGFDEAARRYLCVHPDWCEPQFPITAFTFSYRKAKALAHRDFLGALTALGITRQSIGDILVESGRAVAFVSTGVAKFVKTQIEKIGNEGVDITEGYTLPLPELSKKQSFSATVASGRVDCVVGALCNLSRSRSLEIIENGFVSINSKTVEKSTARVVDGDKISIRGYGRFEIESASELSKKNRVILKYNKYV